MAEEFLHRPNVGPRLEQMRRERMAQRVAGRTLGNPCRGHRILERARDRALVQMMSSPNAAGIHKRPRSAEHETPAKLGVDVLVFAAQTLGETRCSDPRPRIPLKARTCLGELRAKRRHTLLGER